MKRLIPVIIALALIAAIVYFVFYPEYQARYEYSEEYADLNSYFSLTDPSEVAIILQDALISEKARLLDGAYYFDLDTVHTYFNSRFYHDKREKLLLYSLPEDTERVAIGTAVIETRDGQVFLPHQAARYEGDTLWVAADYLLRYTNFSYEAFTAPHRMQVYTEWGDIRVAKANRDTQVRYRGGVKSEILSQIADGTRLIVLEQMETWAKVQTMDGFIGYVENRRLGDIYSERQIPVDDVTEPEYKSQTRDHLISMGWHYVAGSAGNDTIYEVTKDVKGMNVISPTWFILRDSEGNFDSYATQSYVNAAHGMGLEVWALVENITHNAVVDMYELLSSTTKRAYLIEGLIAAALEYGIDGINVDFENLRSDTGEHFVQFIRELSIECREHELVLSVDNYVPYHFNDFYNRGEQGIFADYVVIMGYDEHYRGSEKAGSVASIDYVENGIKNTVDQVPAHKVINGIPFYTRIWETRGASVDSQAVGMALASDWVANRNLTPTWDEVTCQNYAEHRDGSGGLFQVWLEDADSIRVKFNIMRNYEIGGAAFWQLGQEIPEIWDVVLEYVGEQN